MTSGIWAMEGYCMGRWHYLRPHGPATRAEAHEHVARLPRTETWARFRITWIRAATPEEIESSR